MLKNYFLVAIRALMKRSFHFSLTVTGLSVGIAACLLCYLHIQYELSFDKYNPNSDKVFRLVTGDVPAGEGWVKVSTPIPTVIHEQIPEVDQYARLTRVTYNEKIAVRHEDKIFNEARFYMADPAFVEMFDLKITAGNANGLEDLNSVLISSTTALKYFGNADPLGKILTVNGEQDFMVAGVFEDIPHNSHLEFDLLIPFENLEKMLPSTSLTGNWGQYNYFAYLSLIDGANASIVDKKIKAIDIKIDEENSHSFEELGLQPVTDIHFQDNRGNIKASYDPKYLLIYVAVALAILLVSVINFVNLSIAGSTRRVREVGVRKVMGASKGQIIRQFFTESLLISSISTVLALVIMDLFLLPATNNVLGSRMSINYSDPTFFGPVLTAVILIGLASGSYIAFFVTSIQPINAMKKSLAMGTSNSWLKNTLLGVQFCISLILILSSVFIYRQLIFMKDKDIGLTAEQVINISLYNQRARDKSDLLVTELSRYNWVSSISKTRFVPGSANWNNTVWWEGQEESTQMNLLMVDNHVIETLGLELKHGDPNLVASELGEDETRYILNETALDVIGWDNPIDQPFSAFGAEGEKVIGVVADFNYRSLHHTIPPCVLVMTSRLDPSQILVRVETKDLEKVLAQLEMKFREIVPDTPFEYAFLDSQFEKLYEAETRTTKIVSFLTVISIILALLGLYGLLTFVVQERTKEMAIRKVLGVTLPSILGLLSKGYIRLLLLANIIAIPVVWIILNNWLQGFSYRTQLSIPVFIAASLITWFFVLLTIGMNVFQVQRIDPIKGLQNE